MDDLISRHDAIMALADAGIINYGATGNGNGMIQAINVIKALPTVDAVPVIRCKDCIYYDEPHVEKDGERFECRSWALG